jgi:D-isomer specific 2-hydroxyacid dehydrogenase-like protein
MPHKVLVYSRFPKSMMLRIGERFELMDAAGKPPHEVFTAEQLSGVSAMITAGGTPLGGAMMDKMPALRAIVCYGTGYDGVDLAAAAQRRIAVGHSPAANAAAVADLAVTLMLAVTRRLLPADQYVRSGKWSAAKPPAPIPITPSTPISYESSAGTVTSPRLGDRSAGIGRGACGGVDRRRRSRRLRDRAARAGRADRVSERRADAACWRPYHRVAHRHAGLRDRQSRGVFRGETAALCGQGSLNGGLFRELLELPAGWNWREFCAWQSGKDSLNDDFRTCWPFAGTSVRAFRKPDTLGDHSFPIHPHGLLERKGTRRVGRNAGRGLPACRMTSILSKTAGARGETF